MNKISKDTRTELVQALRERYADSTKPEKARILDEFTVLSGFHRKHSIRLMNQGEPIANNPPNLGHRIYDEAVKEAVIVIWEAADRICGKRLKAILPTYLESLEKHGHLKLDEAVRQKLLTISPSSIDRMLSPVRQTAGSRRKKKRIKKISQSIKIKTFQDWQDPAPGYLEIDFVVHGGGSMSGEFIHSLVVTDVCSGWIEAVPLIVREQSLVVEGLKRIRDQMPVAMRGIDSDNDGAFINETLASFCTKEGIEFTRSRAYHKNDQAWIEQKNGAVIRKIIGHERYSGLVAGHVMARLFQAVRLYVNYFQPSFKLRERKRIGSKIKKQYFPPATPSDRLLERSDVSDETKEALRTKCRQLDPVELLHQIRKGQSALAALSAGEPDNFEGRKSLDVFLSEFPQLWKQGEVRPTHRNKIVKPHWWRTREDPFKESWTDALIWLQKEPDITGKTLLQKLHEKYPGQHSNAQLRTLQRRLSEWRHSMARKLVFGEAEEIEEVGAIAVEENPPFGEGSAAARYARNGSTLPEGETADPEEKTA
jgi:hypothetical protein